MADVLPNQEGAFQRFANNFTKLPSSIFGRFGSGEQPKSSPPPPASPEKPSTPELSKPEVHYLSMLETYQVHWDAEKTARDEYQNFFDGNNQILDGVTEEVKQIGDQFNFSITGPSEYDYQQLLHLGGSTKTGNQATVGGFGEGGKVAPLCMLRDMGATAVIHESKDWRVTYYLDDVSNYSGQDGKKVRGLYAKVEKNLEPKHGSHFNVTFPTENTAKAFAAARNLFYHSENPDFQNPTVDNDKGGFTIHVGQKGNLYEAGQRRHKKNHDNSLSWNNVEDVTVWTKQKVFKTDRDRGDVDKYQVETAALPLITASMDTESIAKAINTDPKLWHDSSVFGIGRSLLKELCKTYKKKRGEKIEFPEQYVAQDIFVPPYVKDALKQAGYIICENSLSEVGMMTAMERFKTMMEHYREPTTPADIRRINLLQEFTSQHLNEEMKDVWLYSKANEKSIVEGQYTSGPIWLSQEGLRGSFHKALSLFLHEINHRHGTDQSAEFSYGLTDTLEKYIEITAEKPEIIVQLKAAWEAIAKEEQEEATPTNYTPLQS